MCEYTEKYKTICSAVILLLKWLLTTCRTVTSPVNVETTWEFRPQGWPRLWGSLRIFLECTAWCCLCIFGDGKCLIGYVGYWSLTRGSRLCQLCMYERIKPILLLVILCQHLFQGLFRIAGGASKVKKLKVKKAVTVSDWCFINIHWSRWTFININLVWSFF